MFSIFTVHQVHMHPSAKVPCPRRIVWALPLYVLHFLGVLCVDVSPYKNILLFSYKLNILMFECTASNFVSLSFDPKLWLKPTLSFATTKY